MKTKDSLALKHVKRIIKDRLSHDGYYLKWMVVVFVLAAINWSFQFFTKSDRVSLIINTVWLCGSVMLVVQYFLCKGFVELLEEENKQK